VNNAGVPARADFLEGEPERIEQVMRVNYLGQVWCVRAFLRALEAGRPSHVVHIVSVAGTVAFPPSGPYTASKHAQLAFARATAPQLRQRGIRVHTILPGFVETEGFPQKGVMAMRALEPFVVGPELVAERVLDAMERDRREAFVPRWYRPAAIVQALFPGLVARVLAARDYSSGA
jgi:NAD(P)-dependent dehydrogenase (short-subunit alcohol dehydrogenase family)